MAEQNADRLARLLALVPYLVTHEGVAIDTVTTHFGIDRETLIADLNLLFVSGLPGYLPDDLIEVSWDDDSIQISNVHGIDRPLRLGQREAVALLVGLRALSEVPGLHDTAALEATMAKVRQATGAIEPEDPEVEDAVTLRLPDGVGAPDLDVLRHAITHSELVAFDYTSAQDVRTERTVRPLQVVSRGAYWYLRAWCSDAICERSFRLDRMRNVTATPDDGSLGDVEASSRAGLFSSIEAAPRLEMSLAGRARRLSELVLDGETLSDVEDVLTIAAPVLDPEWSVRNVLGRAKDGITSLDGPAAGPIADEVADRARAALSLYSRMDGNSTTAGGQA